MIKEPLLVKVEEQVLDLIKGRDESCPIPSSQIVQILGLKSSGAVREIVHRLRTEKNYVQILANGDGYFYSDDPEEWRRYAEKLQKRCVQTLEVLQVYKKRLKLNFKQIEISL